MDFEVCTLQKGNASSPFRVLCYFRCSLVGLKWYKYLCRKKLDILLSFDIQVEKIRDWQAPKTRRTIFKKVICSSKIEEHGRGRGSDAP